MRHGRRWGRAPYRVAVLHGGPGATGSVGGLARDLAVGRGVLEPFQSARSVAGQVAELAAQLRAEAHPPVVLIGSSWGAWLAWYTAAEHPALVAGVVLVGSGPFEAHYAESILPTRLERLAPVDRAEAEALLSAPTLSDEELSRLGELLGGADYYQPLPANEPPSPSPPAADIFEVVWPEAADRRERGLLLAAAERITCPVVGFHGAWDPHPAEGVREPLERALTDFRFVCFERCGHYPWRERHAREPFLARVEECLTEWL